MNHFKFLLLLAVFGLGSSVANAQWELPAETARYLGAADGRLPIEIRDIQRIIEPIRIEPKLLAWGYSGAVFGPYAGQVFKISNEVFAALDQLPLEKPSHDQTKVARDWAQFAQILQRLKREQVQLYQRIDVQSPHDDVVVAQLLAKFTGQTFPAAPKWMTPDGLASAAPYLVGQTLGQTLQQFNYGGVNRNELFAELAKWLRLSNKLVTEWGVALDLQSPDNFIVAGSARKPRLELVDFSFVEPDASVKAFYKKANGKAVPKFPFKGEIYTFPATTVPYFPVIGRLWDLQAGQRDDLMKSLYGKLSPDELEAYYRAIPILQNTRNPALNENAWLVGLSCSAAFRGSAAKKSREVQGRLWNP